MAQTSILLLLGLISVVCGIIFDKRQINQKIKKSKQAAKNYLVQNDKDVKKQCSTLIHESKQETEKYRLSTQEDIDYQAKENDNRQQRIEQRERYLSQTKKRLMDYSEYLKEQETANDNVQQELDNLKNEAESLLSQRASLLENQSQTSKSEARESIINAAKNELSREKDVEVRYQNEEIRANAKKIANDLIIDSIQRGPKDEPRNHIDKSILLPNGDIKLKLIMHDEQCLRIIESLTGTDLIFDERDPLLLQIATHDPIRREIARNVLEKLIISRQITPNGIEKQVSISTQDVHNELRAVGEHAARILNLKHINPDLLKILGKLKFRTSYGQNVLSHSIEVAQISGILASELGLNVSLARRAGLFHDIGKAIDHEIDGTHVELGVDLTTAFNEDAVVINAIASHHGDVEPTNLISKLVATADAISGARPGARSESVEEYVNRLKSLEHIANEQSGVKESYAIQAGREIRIILNPELVDDNQSKKITNDVKNRIESELVYPGKIKVTTIRKLRAVQYVGKRKKIAK
ncbi:2,3 cyclic-nucleotide 2-phosphodiesterase [Apilactobacillus ozensis DSM 23829 = JCM 17196]|uniref:Ribonuclease Y n=1 Tax=Apilactobacillus ozensis DSM 23829 = JCM 17196 TaxID=1423781 RepID=A0A0R2AS84_9LACO|nr:ribonuclease Y [Apilactobacillus ozensis]KRM69719.1 2,3 cyclic-nucleotide 2-phosphodiesterase [Apilactobacillus ozensis DSM 23829 = JCM 17196]